jgi:hypothetical protein
MVDMTVPRRKRDSTERQVIELITLLKLWPTVPDKSAKEFVLHTCGIKMTRSAMQEAKRRVGLLTPEHTEQTIKKAKFARLALAAFVRSLGTVPEFTEARAHVRAQLRKRFKQDTNTILLNSWIEDGLKAIADRGYEDVLDEAEQILADLNIKGPTQERQQELL